MRRVPGRLQGQRRVGGSALSTRVPQEVSTAESGSGSFLDRGINATSHFSSAKPFLCF